MSTPFRDEAWRIQRIAELATERDNLERARLSHEVRRIAVHRAILWKRFRSVFGVSVLVLAVAGGYALGRFGFFEAAHQCR